MANRKELARRVAFRGGYKIGQAEEFIAHLEDVIVEALEEGEDVKLGKVLKLFLQEVPEKEAWDGLNQKYFTREAKRVTKFKPLKRLEDIQLPPKN